MTLEEFYYVSQIVAVFAILASLIFVGVQVRQNSEQIKANTRSIKASAGFDATHSWATFNEQLWKEPDWIIQLVQRTYDPGNTWDDFSDIEQMRISLALRALFQKLEGLYYLNRYGSLDEGIWVARRQWAAGAIKAPVLRQWWAFEKTQSTWSDEFVSAIETARDTTTIAPFDPTLLHGAGAPRQADRPQGEAPKS